MEKYSYRYHDGQILMPKKYLQRVFPIEAVQLEKKHFKTKPFKELVWDDMLEKAYLENSYAFKTAKVGDYFLMGEDGKIKDVIIKSEFERLYEEIIK